MHHSDIGAACSGRNTSSRRQHTRSCELQSASGRAVYLFERHSSIRLKLTACAAEPPHGPQMHSMSRVHSALEAGADRGAAFLQRTCDRLASALRRSAAVERRRVADADQAPGKLGAGWGIAIASSTIRYVKIGGLRTKLLALLLRIEAGEGEGFGGRREPISITADLRAAIWDRATFAA